METLTSRRHILNFYLGLAVATFFFLAMGTAAIVIFLKKYEHVPKDYFLPTFGLGTYLLCFYTLFAYRRNVPSISIDKSFISFDNEIFSLSEIEGIVFTGKRNFPYLFSYKMEAATIHFRDGTQKCIFDDMYENAWQMKLFLKEVALEHKPYTDIQETITSSEIDQEVYETYNGNQLISFRGISLWVIVGMFPWSIIKKKPEIGSVISSIVFTAAWFWFNSWMMCYFKLSNDFLIVRNQNFFWKRKAYRLKDIKEVVFDTRPKMPNFLRVITNDFRNKAYPAATLRDKTWLALKADLESKGVHVRNELTL